MVKSNFKNVSALSSENCQTQNHLKISSKGKTISSKKDTSGSSKAALSARSDIDDYRIITAGFIKEKLIKFGFKEDISSDVSLFTIRIFNENKDFFLEVKVTDYRSLEAKLYDAVTEEEYTLHLNPKAQGKFVGELRSFYISALDGIVKGCSDNEPFKTHQAKEIRKFIKEEYGTELEFLWDDSPDCAIMRREDNGKWYGAILTCKRKTLSGSGEGKVEVLNLKAKPEVVDKLIKRNGFFRAYHMNKKLWFSVMLDGGVDFEEIKGLIKESFVLIKISKRKYETK